MYCMHSIHMTYSMHIQCVCLIIRLTPFPNSDLFFPRVESQTASLLLPLDKFYQHAFSSFALAATCQNRKEENLEPTVCKSNNALLNTNEVE